MGERARSHEDGIQRLGHAGGLCSDDPFRSDAGRGPARRAHPGLVEPVLGSALADGAGAGAG